MIDVTPGAAPPPMLVVLVVCAPTEQALLAAALPADTFTVTFAASPAEEAAPPPAVILLSLDDAAALPQIARLGASGAPVVVLLAAEGGLTEAALAAGATDYVYRVDQWTALLPFHLLRAVAAAGARQEMQVLVVRQQRAIRQLAHDLRGPLSYLVGYSELLTMQDLPPAKVQQMAQEMLREAEKLAEQIDRFAPAPTR